MPPVCRANRYQAHSRPLEEAPKYRGQSVTAGGVAVCPSPCASARRVMHGRPHTPVARGHQSRAIRHTRQSRDGAPRTAPPPTLERVLVVSGAMPVMRVVDPCSWQVSDVRQLLIAAVGHQMRKTTRWFHDRQQRRPLDMQFRLVVGIGDVKRRGPHAGNDCCVVHSSMTTWSSLRRPGRAAQGATDDDIRQTRRGVDLTLSGSRA